MAKKKTTKKHKPTMAFHGVSADGTHVVAIEDLRVVLVPDGDGWFAQGLEIDYAAQGSSEKDVKKNFEEGLEATVEAHLKIHGTIEGMLNVAPPEVWKKFLYDPKGKKKIYSQMTPHAIREATNFGNFKFLVATQAA